MASLFHSEALEQASQILTTLFHQIATPAEAAEYRSLTNSEDRQQFAFDTIEHIRCGFSIRRLTKLIALQSQNKDNYSDLYNYLLNCRNSEEIPREWRFASRFRYAYLPDYL